MEEGSDFSKGYHLILLVAKSYMHNFGNLVVTEGCMQNFKTLAQPLLGEFGWGFLLLLLLLLGESKVNSQVFTGMGV